MSARAFGKGFQGAFGKGMKDSPFAQGNQFDDDITIEDAITITGMDFELGEVPSLYLHEGQIYASPKKTIIRTDTGDFISTMSKGYKLVQPKQIIETHRQFVGSAGYQLRSAGVFKNGARFWSMAEAHGELELAGGDMVKSYLFMASAADGSSSTYALSTAMRMHCWNCAPAIIKDAKANGRFIRVTHSQIFDADKAREEISVNDKIFNIWAEDAKLLTHQPITVPKALEYFADVFAIDEDEENIEQRLIKAQDNKRAQKCLQLFAGAGMGSRLESSNGTVWGAYNAITEYIDHHAKTDTPESRWMSSTMGPGNVVKGKAWSKALELIN